jgi:hypothetical protein
MQLYLPTTDECLEANALSQRPIQVSQPFCSSYNDQENNDPFLEFPLPEKEAPPEPLHASHQWRGETLNGFVGRVAMEQAERHEDWEELVGGL